MFPLFLLALVSFSGTQFPESGFGSPTVVSSQGEGETLKKPSSFWERFWKNKRLGVGITAQEYGTFSFNLNAFDTPHQKNGNEFLDFPFPSNLRLDKDKHVDWSHFDMPILDLMGIKELNGLTKAIEYSLKTATYFSPQGAIYFSTGGPQVKLVNLTPPEESNAINSCYQVIDITPNSETQGQRVYADLIVRKEPLIYGDNATNSVVIVKPILGVGLKPGSTYATLLYKGCFTNEKDVALHVHPRLKAVLAGIAPEPYASLYNPAVKMLRQFDVDITKIIALTIHTTSNQVKKVDALHDDIVKRTQKIVNQNTKPGFVLDQDGRLKGDYSEKGGIYRFTGKFRTLNYMQKPYLNNGESNNGGGAITVEQKIKLEPIQPNIETITYTITLPNTDMPADGYPLSIYGHGTGGDHTTHASGSFGEGYMIAPIGVAMLGFDAMLQGDRKIESFTIPVINIKIDTETIAPETFFLLNPLAVGGSVLQTVVDMMMFYNVINTMGSIKLPPKPDTTEEIQLHVKDGLFAGHSQGSQEAGILLGFEPLIKTAFLSQAGGGLQLSAENLTVDFNNIALDENLLSALLNEFDITCPTDDTQCIYKITEIIAKFLANNGQENSSRPTGITDRYSLIFNHVIQPLLDIIDPLNYTERFIRNIPKNQRPKNILLLTGIGDRSTPNPTQFAFAASVGLPLLGKHLDTPDVLKWTNLMSEEVATEAIQNVTAGDGKKVTAGQVLYKMPDKFSHKNPHFVLYYIPETQELFRKFFTSAIGDADEVKITVDAASQM